MEILYETEQLAVAAAIAHLQLTFPDAEIIGDDQNVYIQLFDHLKDYNIQDALKKEYEFTGYLVKSNIKKTVIACIVKHHLGHYFIEDQTNLKCTRPHLHVYHCDLTTEAVGKDDQFATLFPKKKDLQDDSKKDPPPINFILDTNVKINGIKSHYFWREMIFDGEYRLLQRTLQGTPYYQVLQYPGDPYGEYIGQ